MERPVTALAVDSSALIYLVEGRPELRQRVIEALDPVLRTRTGRLLASRLARLECRVRPLRLGNHDLLTRYDQLFAAARLDLMDVGQHIVDVATDLRAAHGFKTPDAIHLATAVVAKADQFVTGDADLARCTVVPVWVIAFS